MIIRLLKKILKNKKSISHYAVRKISKLSNSPYQIVDMRKVEEYNKGHVIGAISIPYNDWVRLMKIRDIDKNKKIILICKYGEQSIKARKILIDRGYKHVLYMRDGIKYWIYETEK